MLPRRKRIAAFVWLGLTAGVTINLLLLQGINRTADGGTPPAPAVGKPAAGQAPADSLKTQPSADLEPSATGLDGAVAPAKVQPVKPAKAAKAANTPAADLDLAQRGTSGSATPQAALPANVPPPDPKLVMAIQRELAQRGYDAGKLNGVPGIMTRAAIMAFEDDQKLALTGEPSEALLRQIVLGLAGGSPDSPAGAVMSPYASRIVAGAQRLLTRLGYDPGPVDGALSARTRKALRKFEADAGLPPRGRISGEVMVELTRRAGARIEVADEALSP